MKYNPDIHHRRSIRLRVYDYSQAGAYFVTVCAQGREPLFGEVGTGEMFLNDAGRMVQAAGKRYRIITQVSKLIATWLCPTHFHGIIRLVGAGPRACPEMNRVHGGGHTRLKRRRQEDGPPQGAPLSRPILSPRADKILGILFDGRRMKPRQWKIRLPMSEQGAGFWGGCRLIHWR